jgi:hypothetical protein
MRGLKKPFKAPRQVRNEKETARQSDSDEDTIPFSELKEKVRSERQGSDSDKDRPRQDKVKMIKLMSEREADECAKFGEVLTWSWTNQKSTSYLLKTTLRDPFRLVRVRKKAIVPLKRYSLRLHFQMRHYALQQPLLILSRI